MQCLSKPVLVLTIILLSAISAKADTRQPAYVLELPESVDNIFIADSNAATLYRFERSASGIELAHESYMSIGQNGVGKQRAGDRRTPLGIYFVVDQLDTSRLHEKYGVTAFPLDYPNAWDLRKERTGDGIWVHGVLAGDGQRPPLDTDGCIALPNQELADQEDTFVARVTPVVVTREMRWASEGEIDALREELRAAIAAWAKHYGNGDLYAYFSLYADDFSYRGMKLGEWASFRLQTFEQRGAVRIAIDELLLIADPEEEGLVLSRFQQTMSGPGNGGRSIKRLYWRRNNDGEWRIVAEDNG
jgi:murein L,D-transpeptidase YafK